MPQVNQFVQQLMQPLKHFSGNRNPRAYTQGLTLYRQKQWQQAVECFTQATIEQPNHAPSHFKLGMSHFRLKEYETALAAVNRALELDPSQTQWQEQLDQTARHVAAKAKQSPSEKEQTIRDQLERLDNPSAHLYNQLAHTLRKQGKWWQEIEALKSAIALESNHPTWFYRLGEALEVMNRYQQAAKAYGNAIELKNGKAEAQWHYRQGYCFAREGHDGAANLKAANEAYQQAIKKDSKLNAKRYGIGVFHQARGHWQQAALEYQQQVAQAPWDAQLHYRLGMAHDRCYEWALAEACYKAALTLDRNQPYWHYRLGFVKERQEKYEQAALAYRYAALNRDKHTPYWFYRWGYVLEQQGNYQAAAEAYLQTRQQPTLDKEAFVEQPADVGATNADEAVAIELMQAVEQEKNVLELYEAQFTSQQFLIYQLEQIVEKDTTNPDVWYQIGNAYEREKNWQAAATAYQHAVALQNTHNHEWLYRFGYVLAQAECYQDACGALREIDLLQGFRRRIKKELVFDMVKLSFESDRYSLTFQVKNNSKINPDIRIKGLLIKHRVRVGNENDSFYLKKKSSNKFDKESCYEFEMNPNSYELKMHYWDLFVEAEVVDKVYGNISIELPFNHYSQTVLKYVSENPWKLAVKNDEMIFHPYLTVGGRKIAFLKRPITQYDDLIYIEREAQALKEYQENKHELDSRKAWMIYEKFSNTAQDNGFYFFKYAVKKRSHVYYVIERDSPDRRFLEGYEENVVEFMSVEHMKLLLSCEMMISSESRSHCYAFRRINGLLKSALLQKKFIFLQHGVVGLKRIDGFFRKSNKEFSPEKFICSSPFEKEIIMTEFGYDEKDMILSGLPRWDGLTDTSDDYNEIFLMPTWRNWLEDMSDDEFLKTDYFKNYSNLLSSPELSDLLAKHDLVLNFYLHPKVIAHLGKFKIEYKNIRIIDFGECTVRELLQRAKLLITDYSSIAWDFVYLKKPVVFYQFDRDEYTGYQGSYINLEKDLPGLSFLNENELIKNLSVILKNVKLHQGLYGNEYELFSDISSCPSEKIFKEIIKN